jgi:hypothetical protein
MRNTAFVIPIKPKAVSLPTLNALQRKGETARVIGEIGIVC